MEKRIKFSLPEAFLLGVLLSAGIASGKAYFDVKYMKKEIKSLQEKTPDKKIDKVIQKLDNLDTKVNGRIDGLYKILLER